MWTIYFLQPAHLLCTLMDRSRAWCHKSHRCFVTSNVVGMSRGFFELWQFLFSRSFVVHVTLCSCDVVLHVTLCSCDVAVHVMRFTWRCGSRYVLVHVMLCFTWCCASCDVVVNLMMCFTWCCVDSNGSDQSSECFWCLMTRPFSC